MDGVTMIRNMLNVVRKIYIKGMVLFTVSFFVLGCYVHMERCPYLAFRQDPVLATMDTLTVQKMENIRVLAQRLDELEREKEHIERKIVQINRNLVGNNFVHGTRVYGTLSSPRQQKQHGLPLIRPDVRMTGNKRQRYDFNCSNIPHISLRRRVGHGVSKQVFLGEYQDRRIAVKMVTKTVYDVTTCMKQLAKDGRTTKEDRDKCYIFPNMKLMKEILLLQQVDHPNFMQMLGFCVRSEETETTDLSEHGVVAVFEYGTRFFTSTLQTWTWEARIKAAIDLADFLDYLERSPIGSLKIADFKEAHFLLAGNTIKMTDLDDVDNIEPTCKASASSGKDLTRGYCQYGLRCVAALCIGHNAKQNLKM